MGLQAGTEQSLRIFEDFFEDPAVFCILCSELTAGIDAGKLGGKGNLCQNFDIMFPAEGFDVVAGIQ